MFYQKGDMSEKMALVLNFPEEKTYKWKIYFHKNWSYFRVYCDSECSWEKNTENKGQNTESINPQKLVTYYYFVKSDVEDNLPSGSHQKFGDDFQEYL